MRTINGWHPVDTLSSTVDKDCNHKVEPSLPDDNGKLGNPVLKVDVDGEHVCIQQGNSMEVQGIEIYVIGIGEELVDKEFFNTIRLSATRKDRL